MPWLAIWICLWGAMEGGAASPAGGPLARISRLPAPEVQPENLLPGYGLQPGPPRDSQTPPFAGEAPAAWDWQVLPQGVVYPAYLASTKESRFAAHVVNRQHDGWLMDAVLGSRVGLLRFGDRDPWLPEGWQVDAEGAAQVRLDIPEDVDVRSVDFRAGLPISYGEGRHRVKFGYYHLSSHVGDEFLLKNPSFRRLNYSRDVLLLGYVFYWTDRLRSYAEAGWAFHDEVSQQWEFQFGLDYAPLGPTGLAGAPFWALNAHLREEVNYGGGLTVQAGWAWRAATSTSLLRCGLHYYNGESNQYSFFDEHEEQIGVGLWYDF